jgi:hypothetical protein
MENGKWLSCLLPSASCHLDKNVPRQVRELPGQSDDRLGQGRDTRMVVGVHRAHRVFWAGVLNPGTCFRSPRAAQHPNTFSHLPRDGLIPRYCKVKCWLRGRQVSWIDKRLENALAGHNISPFIYIALDLCESGRRHRLRAAG